MKIINTLFAASLVAASAYALDTEIDSNVINSSLINNEVSRLEIKQDIIATLNSASLKATGQWVSYQVAMEPNNGMPCCFQDDDGKGCELDKRSNTRGTHHDSEQTPHEDSKVLKIYFKWRNNRPSELFFAGSECPVDTAGHKVVELYDVSQKQSVEFLQRYLAPENSGPDKRVRSKALAGIAMHQGIFAHKTLEKLANGSDDKLSRKAIFWLGEARNKAGYQSLLPIVDDQQRNVKTREKAVFALSQNKYQKSQEKLIQLATKAKNEKIQSAAIFWLAESEDPQASAVIESVIDSDASHYVKKKAIFGLSEVGTKESWQLLVSIAKGDQYPKIRQEAIFWLSQDHSRDAKPVLLDIINGHNAESVKIKAVFALSQLEQSQATDGLIEVLKNAESRRVKKKAMFWLGQSEDPAALAALEKILTASND